MINLEIERKFLLKRLPSITPTDELVIFQLYCENKATGEKFRIRKSGSLNSSSSTYTKTKKKFITDGVYEEDEVEITREEFWNLEPLAYKRISKTRYIYKFGDLKWEVDSYDFKLIVAEIELPVIDYPLELPDYIASNLILEVTKLKEFTNINLAESI